MTVPWASLVPDGGGSARIVSGANGTAPMYAAHTPGAVGAEGQVVVVYVRAAQTLSLHIAGAGGEVAVQYYDPSGGEQARSTAFPVLQKVLKCGGGAPIEVPAQPWVGDGVVILRAVTSTAMILKSDDIEAHDDQDAPKIGAIPATQLKLRVDQTRILASTSDRLVSFTFDFHLCNVEHPNSACNWHK